jgi:plastocyanin
MLDAQTAGYRQEGKRPVPERSSMRKRFVGAVIVVASALAAVSLAFAGSTSLKLSADKNKLSYNRKTLKAHAGKVTIVMTNPSSIFQHNIAIKGNGVKVKGKVVGHGGTSKVTVTLKPGKYEFYCTVPGHEAGGMKGTLIVTK